MPILIKQGNICEVTTVKAGCHFPKGEIVRVLEVDPWRYPNCYAYYCVSIEGKRIGLHQYVRTGQLKTILPNPR